MLLLPVQAHTEKSVVLAIGHPAGQPVRMQSHPTGPICSRPPGQRRRWAYPARIWGMSYWCFARWCSQACSRGAWLSLLDRKGRND